MQTFFILFFGKLFIEDAVLLLVQTDTTETVVAAKAIFAKLTLATVGTVLTVIRHVTVGTVDTLCAPFTTHAERESAATNAFARVASVVHILGIEDTEAVVAILGSHRFREFTILRTILDDIISRLTQKQPLKFRNKVHRMGVDEESLMLHTVCGSGSNLSK